MWSKRWYLQISKYSDLTLLTELKVSEPHDLNNYLRMGIKSLVRPKIEKKKTHIRQSINAVI